MRKMPVSTQKAVHVSTLQAVVAYHAGATVTGVCHQILCMLQCTFRSQGFSVDVSLGRKRRQYARFTPQIFFAPLLGSVVVQRVSALVARLGIVPAAAWTLWFSG